MVAMLHACSDMVAMVCTYSDMIAMVCACSDTVQHLYIVRLLKCWYSHKMKEFYLPIWLSMEPSRQVVVINKLGGFQVGFKNCITFSDLILVCLTGQPRMS